MLPSWMAYAALVSAVLAIAGLVLDHLASLQRWPRRWIWAAVLGASVLWPAAMIAWFGREDARRFAAIAPPAITLPFAITIGAGDPATSNDPANRDDPLSLNRMLGLAWIVASGFLLARLARSVLTLRRRARRWEPAIVDGVAVRLSATDGPGVLNVPPMDIVLPRWILSLDAPLRALVLRHEQEHRAARDPYLLLGASLLVALVPWNPALWFGMRRLRLAIEMDCDARVLRVHPSPERYGLVMLTVAQRQAARPALFATMLSPSTTHLERRILAMQIPQSVARRTKAAALIVAAACVAVTLTFRPAMAQASAASNSAFDAFMASQGFKSWTTVRAVRGNTPPRYPAELRARGTEGAVLTSFVVDTVGRIDAASIRILESTNEAFTGAVRAALPAMRFAAAEVDGRKVKQLVHLPFVFGVGDHAVLPAALDTAHTTTRCDQGSCPVYRLETVVTTVAP